MHRERKQSKSTRKLHIQSRLHKSGRSTRAWKGKSRKDSAVAPPSPRLCALRASVKIIGRTEERNADESGDKIRRLICQGILGRLCCMEGEGSNVSGFHGSR